MSKTEKLQSTTTATAATLNGQMMCSTNSIGSVSNNSKLSNNTGKVVTTTKSVGNKTPVNVNKYINSTNNQNLL
jgi:hypothetical protein